MHDGATSTSSREALLGFFFSRKRRRAALHYIKKKRPCRDCDLRVTVASNRIKAILLPQIIQAEMPIPYTYLIKCKRVNHHTHTHSYGS